MKQIKTLSTGTIRIPSDRTVNLTEADQTLQAARRNAAKVIEGARCVESQMEQVISHYFMGKGHPRGSVFRAMILGSDWCPFSSKRKLLIHIVNDLSLLKSSNKSKFDALLRKVMSQRNAFAHGRLLWDSGKVFLQFFEGNSRTQELSDEYLAEVETCLFSAYDAVFDLAVKIGASEPVQKIPKAAPPV
jgi:hypothetical protein